MNSIVRSQADIGAGANAVQLPELCPKKLCDFGYAVASPLHCGKDDDREETRNSYALRGAKMKLHALWDRLIFKESKEDSKTVLNKTSALTTVVAC